MEQRAPRGQEAAQVRIAGRLANEFLLGIIKIGGFGREVIDGLLMIAISQANIALINRSTELQLAYATLDMAPPDDLRRPASMNAIATSLHIPFETARRRIRSLGEMGILQITPRGVILPQGPVQSPFYRMVATGQYEMVRTLYHRLCDIGAVPDLPRVSSTFDPDNPPIRLVIRLASDYSLRLAEPVTRHIGDVVSGVILMDIIQANTEQMGDHLGGSDAAGAEGFVSDALRRPIRQLPSGNGSECPTRRCAVT